MQEHSTPSTKACKKCGGTDRYPSGGCKPCTVERGRKWRAKNRERFNEVSRGYYQRDRDKINAARATHRIENLEKFRARDKAAYHRDRFAAIEKANRFRAIREGAEWERVDYNAIFSQDSTCYLCGGDVDPSDVHFDHVIPMRHGGTHVATNIRVTHSFCNRSKRDRAPDELPVDFPARRASRLLTKTG